MVGRESHILFRISELSFARFDFSFFCFLRYVVIFKKMVTRWICDTVIRDISAFLRYSWSPSSHTNSAASLIVACIQSYRAHHDTPCGVISQTFMLLSTYELFIRILLGPESPQWFRRMNFTVVFCWNSSTLSKKKKQSVKSDCYVSLRHCHTTCCASSSSVFKHRATSEWNGHGKSIRSEMCLFVDRVHMGPG